MQTNPNREEKNIVEWDWLDLTHRERKKEKFFNRRLRRKLQKRILDKAIQDAILKA